MPQKKTHKKVKKGGMINPFSMTPENFKIWQAQHANQNAKWQGDIMGLTGSARTGQGLANFRQMGIFDIRTPEQKQANQERINKMLAKLNGKTTGQGFGPANYRRAGTGIKIVHRSSRGAGLGLGNTFATNPFIAL
jgi:hypothetical protein